MAGEAEDLKNMILNFRVSELQMLLGFAGRNKSGRKNELQQRALELVRVRSQPVYLKIRELYKSIQQSGALTNNAPVNQAANVAAKDLQSPPALTANMPQPPSNIQRVLPFNATADGRQLPPVIHNKPRSTTMYTQPTLYQYAPPAQFTPAKPTIQNAYPVHPDVRLKRLPFFDILADLIKPSTLVPQNSQRMQDASYVFHLTPAQATDIAFNRDLRPDSKLEYVKQVQLRFCLLETSCEQEDFFPPNVVVKVNNKLCPLPNPIPTNKPGVDPKRPPRPVNITPLIKLNPSLPNTISVSWATEYGRGYVMSVMLVHKLNSGELLQRLKQRGIKHSDFTRGLIKEKLSEDADCEIATLSLRVSLMCPLGKMRMTTPCRATTCQHLQCFDASLFLQMNERKPTWNCPVCDKPALYDHLVIDGYFQDVLASATLPKDTNEIQLHKDGSWSTQVIVKKESAVKAENLDESVQIIDDDVISVMPDDKSNVRVSTSSGAEPNKNSTVVDLTLSDSEDEAPAKRKTPPKPDSTNTFNDITSVSSMGSIVQLCTTSGSSSVSSSGYRSPSIITLDSPSPPPPPTSPSERQRQACALLTPPPRSRSSCMMNSTTPLLPASINYQPQQQQQQQQQQQSHLTNMNTVSLSSANAFNNMALSFLDTTDSNPLGLPFLDTDDALGPTSFFPQF